MIEDLPLIILSSRFAICRLPAGSETPDWARPGELLALVQTPDELSILCEERFVPPEVKAERGWRALQVQGTLDFSLIGVLAGIAGTLAQAGVSLFAQSTFDTDYILVKDETLERALDALRRAGFILLKPL